MLNYEEVMKRLQSEGYENCRGDGHNQIIVNNRGEIDFWDLGRGTEAQIYNRAVRYGDPDYGLGDCKQYVDIDSLFNKIASIWTKKEPK